MTTSNPLWKTVGLAGWFVLVACAEPPTTTSARTDTDDFESETQMPTTTSGPQTTTEIPTTGPTTQTDTDTDSDTSGSDTVDSDSETDPSETTETSDTTDSDSESVECGDGIVNGGEVCDDGVNDGSYGGCSENCDALGPFCGDANLDSDDGETCDDGVNDNSYGGCAEDCSTLAPYCGDAVVDDSETCDDGINDNSYGGCAEDCTLGPLCGDGFLDEGFEVCDDGLNDNSYGGCAEDCMALGPYCGDGEVQEGDGETCDGFVAQTCQEMLFFAGEISCSESCTIEANCTGFLDTFEITQAFADHWTVGGDAEFFAVGTMEVNDAWSGETGNITHNQSSFAELVLHFDTTGEISFAHREACEANYDVLTFFIDGDISAEWSGNNPTTLATFPVTAGEHTFRWEYSKDGSVSALQDTVWIDDISSEVGYLP